MNTNAVFNLIQAILLVTIVAMNITATNNYDKRIEILNCRLEVANARIDLLNGIQVERPNCLGTLTLSQSDPAD